jgi:hypothetical protein
LSFPLMVKFFTLSFFVGFGLAVAEGAGFLLGFTQEWVIFVLSVSVQALMFWRLNCHLQSINT